MSIEKLINSLLEDDTGSTGAEPPVELDAESIDNGRSNVEVGFGVPIEVTRAKVDALYAEISKSSKERAAAAAASWKPPEPEEPEGQL